MPCIYDDAHILPTQPRRSQCRCGMATRHASIRNLVGARRSSDSSWAKAASCQNAHSSSGYREADPHFHFELEFFR